MGQSDRSDTPKSGYQTSNLQPETGGFFSPNEKQNEALGQPSRVRSLRPWPTGQGPREDPAAHAAHHQRLENWSPADPWLGRRTVATTHHREAAAAAPVRSDEAHSPTARHELESCSSSARSTITISEARARTGSAGRPSSREKRACKKGGVCLWRGIDTLLVVPAARSRQPH